MAKQVEWNWVSSPSLVPIFGSATIAFSRNSRHTFYNYEGMVWFAEVNEPAFEGYRRVRNLVSGKSEDWTNAAWTKSNMTATATTLEATAGNATCLQTYTSASQDFRLRVSIARQVGSGNIDLTLNGGGSWTTVSVTGAQKVFSISGTGLTNPQFGIRIVTSGDKVNATKIQLENVSYLIDTDPSEYVSVGVLSSPWHGAGADGLKWFNRHNGNTVASNVVTEAVGQLIDTDLLRALKIWGQRTNRCLQSESLGTSPWADVGTPTLSAAAARSGELVLDLLGDDDSGSVEGRAQDITFVGNGVKAISFFCAAGTATKSCVRLRDVTAATNRMFVEIDWTTNPPTITVVTGDNEHGTFTGINLVGGGTGLRLQIITTSVTAANVNRLLIAPACDQALTASLTGNAYFGGFSCEDDDHTSGYIKTTSAVATRERDVPLVTSIPWFNATEGTMVVEAWAPHHAQVGDNACVAAFDDNTANETIAIIRANSLGFASVIDGGVNQATFAATGEWANAQRAKLAMRYKANDIAIAKDGGPVTTDTSATLPTVTQLSLGYTPAGNALNGRLRSFAYYDTAVPDADLTQLSVVPVGVPAGMFDADMTPEGMWG